MSPPVNSCCCCISLRNGCIIIGIILVVFSVSDILWGPKLFQPEENEEIKKENLTNIVLYTISCVEFALGLLILYAACMGLSDWLRLIAMAFLVYILVIVLMGLLFAILEMNYYYIGISALWFLMRLYFTLIIWSYYLELLDEYSYSNTDGS